MLWQKLLNRLEHEFPREIAHRDAQHWFIWRRLVGEAEQRLITIMKIIGDGGWGKEQLDTYLEALQELPRILTSMQRVPRLKSNELQRSRELWEKGLHTFIKSCELGAKVQKHHKHAFRRMIEELKPPSEEHFNLIAGLSDRQASLVEKATSYWEEAEKEGMLFLEQRKTQG